MYNLISDEGGFRGNNRYLMRHIILLECIKVMLLYNLLILKQTKLHLFINSNKPVRPYIRSGFTLMNFVQNTLMIIVYIITCNTANKSKH